MKKILFGLATIVAISLFFFTSSAQAYRIQPEISDWYWTNYTMNIPQYIFNQYTRDRSKNKLDRLVEWFWVGNNYNIPVSYTCTIDTKYNTCKALAYVPQNHYEVGLVLLDKYGNHLASYWFPVFK